MCACCLGRRVQVIHFGHLTALIWHSSPMGNCKSWPSRAGLHKFLLPFGPPVAEAGDAEMSSSTSRILEAHYGASMQMGQGRGSLPHSQTKACLIVGPFFFRMAITSSSGQAIFPVARATR